MWIRPYYERTIMTQPDELTINNRVTEKQKICMAFLSDKMEATAKMVGYAIEPATLNPTGKGARMLGRLRKMGFVMKLPELNAWRLTREGREYVTPR